MQPRQRKYLWLALVSGLIIALDQLTKYLVCSLMPLHSRVELLHGFLDLVHIRNTGIAFGLLKGFGAQFKTVALLIICGVTLALFAFICSQIARGRTLQNIGFALILGGACGNLIDRLRIGEVIDFIDAHWRWTYHWPAFNVADSAITVGIILILFCELILHRPKAEKRTD
jgi:signal peptidase II